MTRFKTKLLLTLFVAGAFYTSNALATNCLNDRERSTEWTNAKRDLRPCNDDDFDKKDMSFCSLVGFSKSLSNRNLKGFNFRGSYIDGVNFSGSNLKGANFEGAYGSGVNFNNVESIKDANFNHSLITNSNFNNIEKGYRATFLGADLTDSTFHRSDLEKAKFSGADLGGVSFLRATLKKANFKGYQDQWVVGNEVNFANANLKDADLTGFWGCYSSKSSAQTKWNGAVYDNRTKLPPHTFNSQRQKQSFTSFTQGHDSAGGVMRYAD